MQQETEDDIPSGEDTSDVAAGRRALAVGWFRQRSEWLAMVLRRHLKVVSLAICALLFVCGGVYFALPVSAQFLVSSPQVNAPIAVVFSRPVRSTLKYSLSPVVKGKWSVSKSAVGGVTEVTFYPAQSLLPGAHYRIVLANVHSMLGIGSLQSPSVMQLATQKLQPVTVVSPAVGRPVATQADVEISMPHANDGVRNFVLTSSDAPLVSARPITKDERHFTWRFTKLLAQGTTYHLVLKDINRSAAGQSLQTITFTTVSAPQVTSATTTDHLYPSQPITIVFAQAMVTTNNSAFTFGCNGTGKWQDVHTYSFMAATLPPATTCQYTLHKGIHDTEGGVVEADQTYTVSSPGAAVVTGSSPRGSGIGLGKSVSITFDQPVDHTSAQQAFSISPAATGSFSWSDNTMTFRPGGLDYQTTYTVSVTAGVKATYGLPGVRAFSAQFTTVPQIIKLAVPAYKQQYALSCEESALRMALAYRGIGVSDMDVLLAEGYDPTNPQLRNGSTWQNPYETFVGDVNGKEDVTGWGAYGPVIAKAAQKLGGNASYVAGITPQQVSAAIHANNPAVVWGVIGSTATLDSWNTIDAGTVTVAKNAHVRTVYGVQGSADNPLGFYIHDPIYGDLYWTTAQLQSNLTGGGNLGAQGVIVY